MSASLAAKPRLKLVAGAIWSCFDQHIERKGAGPAHAYQRWLHASIKAAENAARIAPARERTSRSEIAKSTPRTWEAVDGVLHAPGRPILRLPARGGTKPEIVGPVEQAAAAVSVALPETKEEFRALVDSLDLATEVGPSARASHDTIVMSDDATQHHAKPTARRFSAEQPAQRDRLIPKPISAGPALRQKEAPRKAAPASITAPTYTAAQVQQVGAPVAIRPAYSTPAGMRINQARAEACQPALSTISSPATGDRH